MSLTKLESTGLYAGIIFGLTGMLLSGLSYFTSRDALKISEATARAQVKITRAYLKSPPEHGKHIVVDLELQNFGQSAASNVRASFFHSKKPFSPFPAGLQGSMPPGYAQTISLTDQYTWPETDEKNVAFFITVSFVDTSTGNEYESETAYYVRDLTAQSNSGSVELNPMVTP